MSLSKNQEAGSGSRPRIRQIVLEVTQACNLDCSYCYNVWKAPGRNYPRGSLRTEELLRLLKGLVRDLSLESVAISGGEPFLRLDLPEIVAFLWTHHVETIVITNGTLLTRERIRQTPGVARFELPLLSFEASVHDRLTRHQAFDAVVRGASNLRRLGQRFSVAFICTRENYRDLATTLELAVALGADGFMFNRLNAAAHNAQYLEKLLPSPAMVRENLDVLEEFAAKYGFPISCGIPIQPCLIDTSHYRHVRFGFCPRAGEDSYFTVDPLGNLRVCNHSSVILGSLLKCSFWELYETPYVGEFRTLMPESCRRCPAEVRDLCHGGCKAAAAECYGTFRVEEPFLECNLCRQVTPRVAASASG